LSSEGHMPHLSSARPLLAPLHIYWRGARLTHGALMHFSIVTKRVDDAQPPPEAGRGEQCSQRPRCDLPTENRENPGFL
jgi:hypothetical protein